QLRKEDQPQRHKGRGDSEREIKIILRVFSVSSVSLWFNSSSRWIHSRRRRFFHQRRLGGLLGPRRRRQLVLRLARGGLQPRVFVDRQINLRRPAHHIRHRHPLHQ